MGAGPAASRRPGGKGSRRSPAQVFSVANKSAGPENYRWGDRRRIPFAPLGWNPKSAEPSLWVANTPFRLLISLFSRSVAPFRGRRSAPMGWVRRLLVSSATTGE